LDEDLLYLFYGRPSYRATTETATNLQWNAPVGFIIDPAFIGKIERVLPFDSGAFESGRYGKVFAPASRLDNFLLEDSLDGARKYLQRFFGTNVEYLRSRSSTDHTFGNMDFELQGLEHLSRQPSGLTTDPKVTTDERSSAIEIQVSSQVPLGQALCALIVPDSILSAPPFLDATKKWSLGSEKIVPYDNVVGPGPEAWVGQFYAKTLDFYRAQGYIK
jgi:hypothetical protein